MEKHSLILCEEFAFKNYNLQTWKKITEGQRVHVDVRYKRNGKYISNKLPMIMISNYDAESQLSKEVDKKAFQSRCKVVEARAFEGDQECYAQELRYLAQKGDKKNYNLEEITKMPANLKKSFKHNKNRNPTNRIEIMRNNIRETPNVQARADPIQFRNDEGQNNSIQINLTNPPTPADNTNSATNLTINPPTPADTTNSASYSIVSPMPSNRNENNQGEEEIEGGVEIVTAPKNSNINIHSDDSGMVSDCSSVASALQQKKTKKMSNELSDDELLNEVTSRFNIKQLLGMLSKRKVNHIEESNEEFQISDDQDSIDESLHVSKRANTSTIHESNNDATIAITQSSEKTDAIITNLIAPPPSLSSTGIDSTLNAINATPLNASNLQQDSILAGNNETNLGGNGETNSEALFNDEVDINALENCLHEIETSIIEQLNQEANQNEQANDLSSQIFLNQLFDNQLIQH